MSENICIHAQPPSLLLSITVPAIQYIYLDFDGETTSYRGEALTVDDVTVADSGISEERIAELLRLLNERFAESGAVFVAEKPEGMPFSTIYVGKTAAFDKYGNFTGIAETVDKGNLNRADNAFVNLDGSAPLSTLADVIAHEAEHLLGTLDHGGDGLGKYGYDYFYRLLGEDYYYGYSDTIRNGTMHNATDRVGTHHLTYSVKNPSTGSYVTVQQYAFSTGGPYATVSHPQPAVQKILGALNISMARDLQYNEIYGKVFTIQEKWYSTSGGRRDSDDYYCYDTLTVIPTGLLLLKATTLATGNGITNYQDAGVKADQKTLSGLIVGQNGNGNLIVNAENKSGQLTDTTVTQNGRVEINNGEIKNCTVENGGVISLREYVKARNTTINKDGKLYYNGDAYCYLLSTTVNAGGDLYVTNGNVFDATVNWDKTTNQGGSATFSKGVSLNRYIEIEAGGSISVSGQLTSMSGCDLTLDVSNNNFNNVTMVSGFKYLPAEKTNKTTITINVSATPKEKKESYNIASGININAMPSKIYFTVEGKQLEEKYEGQYTFVWDEDQEKYTGINYNGYNYVLSNDGGNLTLSVVKNVANIFLYAGDCAGFLVSQWNNLTTRNDVNIYTFADYNNFPDELDIYIGTGAVKARKYDVEIVSGSTSELTNFLSYGSNLKETVNTLIIGAHGNGLVFTPDKSIAATSLKMLNDYNISVLAFTPCCLMSGIEVAYSCLKTSISHIVATEAKTSSHNNPDYKSILKKLLSANIEDANNIATTIQGEIPLAWLLRSKPDSATIIYENKTKNLFGALNDFAEKCKGISSLLTFILQARMDAKCYYEYQSAVAIDLKDFMRKLKNNLSKIPQNDKLKDIISSCDAVIRAVDSCIDTSRNLNYSPQYDYGLSCYMPISMEWGFSSRYPAGLYNLPWGQFVRNLYEYATKNPLPKYIKDNSMPEVELANGDSAADTGNFSKNINISQEVVLGDGDRNSYAVTLTDKGTAADAISVTGDSGANISLDIYDASGTTLLQSADGLGSAQISLNGLAAGTYVYSVSADQATTFDIEYLTSQDTGMDHLDLLSGSGNETKENALAISEGNYKGLVASKSNPDWYYIDTFYASAPIGSIGIWGSEIICGSISPTVDTTGGSSLCAYIVDDESGDKTYFVWNPENNMYEADFWGSGYLYVAGQNNASTVYNIIVDSENIGSTIPNVDYTTKNFDVAVEGKQARNFAVETLQPGVYTVSGEFAAGLNATITVTDLATGKKVGSLTVKKGVITKPTSFVLDGGYMFSIAGDGKTAGACSITLDGKVNNAVDHSDDNIELARRYYETNYLSDSVGFGDTVDWILTDIAAPGRYTVSLSGIDAAAKVTVTLWSSLNGGAAKKISSKSATGKDIVLSDLLLAYEDGMEYFVSVNCDNAAKGVFTDYTLSISGDTYDSLYSNPDNNAIADAEILTFKTGTTADKTTGSYLRSASADGWVGYGDTVDMMTFEVTSPAQYSVKLKADVAKSVTMKLQSVTVDPNTGAYKYTDVASGKADANGVISFSNLLQAGAFVLTVTGNDQKTDKFNTAYTVTVDETTKFATINTSSGENFDLKAGEIKTFTLTAVQKISLNKNANLSLWTGNGKNGKTTVKLAYDKTTKTYDATLKPGTYFLTASKAVSDLYIVGAYPDGYGSSMFTDNNSFYDASEFYGSEESFVGFGDGVDYYRFPVSADTIKPGSYVLTLSDAVSNYVSVTAYAEVVSNGKVSYKQLAKFTHKKGEETSVALKDLTDGNYYIKVESLSYSSAAKAKDSPYKVKLSYISYYKELSVGSSVYSTLAKGNFAYYQGQGDGSGVTVYRIDARVAGGYEVYVNNGNCKLTKVKTYNNTFILEDDRLFYVKATKDNKNYSQGIVLSKVSDIDTSGGFSGCFSDVGADNLRRLGTEDGGGNFTETGWSGWIGYTQASRELSFWVGDDLAVSAGWAKFEVASIDKSLGDTSTVKFTLALEKLENGTWKKVASTTAQSAYDKKTASYKLTGKALEAAVTGDAKYRIVISTSDKGAGQCSGYFTVKASVDIFTADDNTLASATALAGNVSGTVVKKSDVTDVYDLADIDSFYFNMDSGAAKLTFYDDNYDAVKLTGSYLINTAGTAVGSLKKAASVTLKAGDAKCDGFTMAASDLLDYGIRFVRIDAAGSANNHYHIAATPKLA